jgi:anaerobic magnesium-protoporphyrin IX monomethyl ester cyclase
MTPRGTEMERNQETSGMTPVPILLRAGNLDPGMPDRPIRVLLIQPPTRGCVRSLLAQVGEDYEGIGFKPPVGLLSVATTLARRSPHAVRVVDAIAQRLDFDQVAQIAMEYVPDLVGISVWTDFWWPALETARRIKRVLPGVHVCCGGPHTGIFPQETLDKECVDSVVVGDGELPCLALANMIANGRWRSDLPGLHLKAAGVKSGEQTFYIHRNLDELPIIDRRLLDIDRYGSVLARGKRVSTMITSRGCPGRCNFCKLNFQKTLSRSPQNVMEEFRRIRELGIGEVEVYDDTFTWSKKRVQAICEGLIREKSPVEWAIRDRVDRADPELIRLMRRAGCTRVHYGIESGVDRVLRSMGKNTTVAQARDAVRWAKQAGMTVLTYFMFGNWDETIEEMEQTLDVALSLDADYAEFSITIPYPGTSLYQMALDAGLIRRDYWREFAQRPDPDFCIPQVVEQHASMFDLIAMRNKAIRRFYFRPTYVLRQIWQTRRPGVLLRRARMGWQLLQSVYRRAG